MSNASLDMQGLIRRIVERRRMMGLSQRALAQRAGLSEGYISHLERGFRNPSVQVLLALCYALQLSPNALMLDSMPDDFFGEALPPTHARRLPPADRLRNTLTNWLCTNLPDETLLPCAAPASSEQPRIPFLSLRDDLPSPEAVFELQLQMRY